MIELDLARLHYAVEHLGVLGRGEGKTTAMLYLLLGEIQLGTRGGLYIYATENRQCLSPTARCFRELLDEYQIDGSINQLSNSSVLRITIESTNQTILFVAGELFCDPYFIKGKKIAKVFFDISRYKEKLLDKRGGLSAVFAQLLITDAEIIG